eukprot:TRINITY_DN81_c0_g1_i4.p1 TRINITY_DN81_c0_g1~~TRINITY_DN81_c0_g1_i4.p1  ORF type:complete len:353 (-),score=85.31 TRINITY_DN81_c0_g1_i4:836-1894(-)
MSSASGSLVGPGGPKKEGAGGKGTWGKPGDEYKYGTPAPDLNDPNYDSTEEDVVIPNIPPRVQFKESAQKILEEYFSSGEWDDALKSLSDLDNPEFSAEFVKQALIFALERKERERELTSVLITHMYEDKNIGPDNIIQGFVLVLSRLDDLVLDTPDAEQVLSIFLARAIVDDAVPPAFLNREETTFGLRARQVQELASGMLKGKHVAQRLLHGWGPGDGKSVKRLKERVLLVLEEYISTRDLKEADKGVRELNSPSFHFYLVKRAITMGIERFGKAKDLEGLHELLGAFYRSQVLSQQQVEKGFRSLKTSLPDLQLDIPDAPNRFASFAAQAVKTGYLTDKARQELAPSSS